MPSFPALSTVLTRKLYPVSGVSPVYSYELGKLVCSFDAVHVLAALSLYSNIYFAIPEVVSVPLPLTFTVTVLSVLVLKLRFTADGADLSIFIDNAVDAH